MAQKLFETASIQAVADAIRAKDGNAALMTAADMPARIAGLLAPGERECWIEKPLAQALPGVTVAGHFEYNYTLETYGFGFDNYALLTAMNSNVEVAKAQVFPYSRKVQLRFGKEGQRTIMLAEHEGGDAVYLGAPFMFTASKDGFRIEHKKSSEPFAVTSSFTAPANPVADEIRLFGGATDSSKFGIFKYVKFYDADMVLAAHYSFVVNNRWQAFMVERVSGARWPLPAGYIAHVDMDAPAAQEEEDA